MNNVTPNAQKNREAPPHHGLSRTVRGLYSLVFLTGLIIWWGTGTAGIAVGLMCGPGIAYWVGVFTVGVFTRGRAYR